MFAVRMLNLATARGVARIFDLMVFILARGRIFESFFFPQRSFKVLQKPLIIILHLDSKKSVSADELWLMRHRQRVSLSVYIH